MLKKIILVLSLTVISLQPTTAFASELVPAPTCVDIRSEAIRLCNKCKVVPRDATVTVGSNFNEAKQDLYRENFSQNDYNCKDLIPFSTSNNNLKSFFTNSESKINCTNIQKTMCEANTNSTKTYPELTPSNSEFFNVTDPSTGLLAQPNQGSSFQAAVEQNGPILGPILLIINFLTGIIATLAILALVLGGFFMVTARGEESQITRGKDIVKNSIIAIVIVLGSYTLIRTIQATILLILN